MQRIKSGLTALAVGIVLLAALDWAAAAATGQSLVLGKWNQADQTTTIKNVGSGPALDIRAKGPAIAIHNANRIKNLNADKLDGKDAADLAASKQTVYVYGATSRVGGFTQTSRRSRRAATWWRTPRSSWAPPAARPTPTP